MCRLAWDVKQLKACPKLMAAAATNFIPWGTNVQAILFAVARAVIRSELVLVASGRICIHCVNHRSVDIWQGGPFWPSHNKSWF